MAVEYPFTTEDKILAIIGQLGVDLRLDDAADADEVMEFAIDEATGEVFFYLYPRYSAALASQNNWVQWHAAWFAVLVLCRRRLNDVPQSVKEEWARREKQLTKVQELKASVPELARSRRPAVVTGYTVDLRRFNNQVRVDRSKSTGVAKNYRRAHDDSAPDNR
jgi:hypothetical protein